MPNPQEIEAFANAQIDDMLNEVRDNIAEMGRERAMASLQGVIQLLAQISPASVATMMSIITTRLAEFTTPAPAPAAPGQGQVAGVQLMELDADWFATIQASAKEMLEGVAFEITSELAKERTEIQVAMDITAVGMNANNGSDPVTVALGDACTLAFVMIEHAKLKQRFDMLEMEVKVNGR